MAECGERSGVGNEVAPELVAQALPFGGKDEGFDAAVGGVGLAFERSAPGEPVNDGGEVRGVIVELLGADWREIGTVAQALLDRRFPGKAVLRVSDQI